MAGQAPAALPMDSPEAARLLSALRVELRKEQVAEGPGKDYLFCAPRLLRFLEGNEGSVQDAAAHFRQMLQWRKQQQMDVHRAQVAGKPWSPQSVPGLPRLLKLMSTDTAGRSPEGQMLWVQCDGRAQIEGLMELPEEDLFHTLHLMCELRQDHLDALSAQTGRLQKVVQVRDLTGLSISKVVRDGLVMTRLRKVLRTVNLAYPENLSKVVILNPPAGFSVLWSMLTPLFNARIRQKFRFAGRDFAKELVEEGGTAALEALARARQDLPAGSDCMEIAAGEEAYMPCRVAKGELAEWRFDVAKGSPRLHFSVVFFPDARGRREQPVSSQAASRGLSGRFVADQDGLLWLTWSNSQSWAATARVEHVVLRSRADTTLPIKPRRVQHRHRERRPSRSWGRGCFEWLGLGGPDPEPEPESPGAATVARDETPLSCPQPQLAKADQGPSLWYMAFVLLLTVALLAAAMFLPLAVH